MNDPLDGFRGESDDIIPKLHRAVRVGGEAADLLKTELGRSLAATAGEVMDEAESAIMNVNPQDSGAITQHQISYKAANMAITWLIKSINAGKAAEAQLLQEQENQHA